jgi:radical SAM protein with 4Fe4S-binding SPASM domain
MSNPNGKSYNLEEIKIEVTYFCTMNCIHCSSDARPSNTNTMRWDDCKRILDGASKLGAKKIAFSGGEPFSWEYLFEAIEEASQKGLDVTLYTSGNTNDIKKKISMVKEKGARRLVFSLFGGTVSTHERVTRIIGSFKKTLEAIDEAKSIGLETEIHFVPMSTNYRELKMIAEIALKHKTIDISVLRLVPQGRALLLQGRILNRVQNLELRRQIQQLRKKGFNIRTGSPYNFLMLNASPKCQAGIDRLIIGPDLRIYPCDAFKQVKAEDIVGTLEHSSILKSDIEMCWNNSPFLSAVREHITSNHSEPCLSCRFLDNCVSGCLAQKAIIYGNLEKRPDPDCIIVQ